MRYTHKLKEPDGNCNYFLIPDKEECDNAENKLGQLEDILENHNIETLEELDGLLWYVKQIKDIEDELGIDLITYVKAHMNCVYIKQGKKIIEVDTPPITIFRNNNWCLEWFYYELRQGYAKVKIKDYGKTWALTKEELL